MTLVDDADLLRPEVSIGWIKRFSEKGHAILHDASADKIVNLGSLNEDAKGDMVWFEYITEVHGKCLKREHVPAGYDNSHVKESVQDTTDSPRNPLKDDFGTKNDLLNKNQ